MKTNVYHFSATIEHVGEMINCAYVLVGSCSLKRAHAYGRWIVENLGDCKLSECNLIPDGETIPAWPNDPQLRFIPKGDLR